MESRSRSEIRATAIIVVAAALYFGTRAPFINEYVYLVRLRHVARPQYIQGDWSLNGSFGENLVFNTLLAPLANVLSIVAIAWLGRVIVWVTLARLVVAFGRRIALTPTTTAVAVCIWMPWQVKLVGADWMFGSFEAKPIAYCCLLAGIIAACDNRVPGALLLAGATISLHPGVGVMAAPALIVALLARRTTRARTVRWIPILLVGAGPGIFGIVRDFGGSSGNRALWKLMALHIYPFHLNPWHFGVLSAVAIAAMLVATISVLRKDPIGDHATRATLIVFTLAAAVPPLLGVVAFGMGHYELLRFFPFRVFPVWCSLLFTLMCAHQLQQFRIDRSRSFRFVLVLGAAAAAVVAQNPVRSAAFLARRNAVEWHDPRSDLQLSYDWIRNHTPPDAVLVAPPGLDPHYDTQRRQIATFGVPRWDRVEVWETRMLAQLGSDNRSVIEALNRGRSTDDLYHELTPERLQSLSKRYGATLFVADRDYPLPIAHRQGLWIVYRLPG